MSANEAAYERGCRDARDISGTITELEQELAAADGAQSECAKHKEAEGYNYWDGYIITLERRLAKLRKGVADAPGRE